MKGWEYRIVKSDLWWIIYKKREYKWMFNLYFLSGKWVRVSEKTLSKVFYHKEDAIAALTLAKYKDGKENAD